VMDASPRADEVRHVGGPLVLGSVDPGFGSTLIASGVTAVTRR
jgi:hypothetical protein